MASSGLSSARHVSVRCAVIGDDDDSTALIANHLLSRCEFGLTDILYEAQADMMLDGNRVTFGRQKLKNYFLTEQSSHSFLSVTLSSSS
jgi:hypothetical protein